MNLAATTEMIRAVLDNTASPNVTFWASYRDIDQNGKVTHGNEYTAGSGTTAVNIVTAPGEVTQRVIDSIIVYNGDDASRTVTVSFYDGTNEPKLIVMALATLTHLQYERGRGWFVMDAVGKLKVEVA